MIVALLTPSVSAQQASGEPAQTIGGKPPPGPCVQVDIAGARAGHLECATQKLQAAGRQARDAAQTAFDTPVPRAGSADVTVGVASRAGTRLRMGTALGRSVRPDRAPLPPPGRR